VALVLEQKSNHMAKLMTFKQTGDKNTTILEPLYRSTCVSWHSHYQTGFCWSRFTAHITLLATSAFGSEDARVLFNCATYIILVLTNNMLKKSHKTFRICCMEAEEDLLNM